MFVARCLLFSFSFFLVFFFIFSFRGLIFKSCLIFDFRKIKFCNLPRLWFLGYGPSHDNSHHFCWTTCLCQHGVKSQNSTTTPTLEKAIQVGCGPWTLWSVNMESRVIIYGAHLPSAQSSSTLAVEIPRAPKTHPH